MNSNSQKNEKDNSGEAVNDDNSQTAEYFYGMSAKEAYFSSLNEWVKQANISQSAMALFPFYLLNSYPHIFQNRDGFRHQQPFQRFDEGLGLAFQYNQPQPVPPNNDAANLIDDAAAEVGIRTGFGNLRILDTRTQAEIISRQGGYEYVIAPFWKRAVAEMIDVVVLLLLKVMVTFMLMNILDLELGFDIDKDIIRKAMEDDDYTNFLAMSMEFIAFSSDLLMLEVLTKVVVCFYEAIWTGLYNGATPGKAALKIRILYVEAILPIVQPQPPLQPMPAQRPPLRAVLHPAQTPGFKRALMRAIAKNFIMTLLFPMCFLMFFFKNNRTAYDILTKTVVVEENPNPLIRRPQQ